MGAYVWHELVSRKLLRPVAAALFGMGAIPNVPLPPGTEDLVERTVRALAPAYAGHPGRLGLLKVAGAGHELTPGMAEAAAGWLTAWRPDA